MKSDFHIHSYFSDGTLSPEDIAKLCVENGVKIAALTDHDNMNGSRLFERECALRGVKCIKGIEISAYTDVKVHILGYNVDDECQEYKKFYTSMTEGALVRAEDILSKLRKSGIYLSFNEVLRERKCESSPVHTTYIARAAARKGYSRSPSAFYSDYLAPGKAAYSAEGRPAPEYALQVIAACGGFSSLAHPGRITLENAPKIELIKCLCSQGLRGIEAVYSGHTDKETAYFKELAAKFGLLVTGGSDTHYAEGNRHIGTPVFNPSEELLAALNLL